MDSYVSEETIVQLYGNDFDFDYTVYGLAPHDHDYQMLMEGKIGQGATTLRELSLNEHGHYVGDGYVFIPDKDCPGCGTFYYRRYAFAEIEDDAQMTAENKAAEDARYDATFWARRELGNAALGFEGREGE